MSAHVVFACLALASPLLEILRLRRLGSRRDVAVFAILWAMAAAAIVGPWLGMPPFRPLDWIRAVSGPFNAVFS